MAHATTFEQWLKQREEWVEKHRCTFQTLSCNPFKPDWFTKEWERKRRQQDAMDAFRCKHLAEARHARQVQLRAIAAEYEKKTGKPLFPPPPAPLRGHDE